ncbi:MAG TPA: protein phosphatase 2C domain-containing protein [Candidatus Limnocylindrales bacterium]
MRRQKPVDGSSVARSGPPGMGANMAAAGPPGITFSLATDVGRVRRNNEDFGQAERVLRGNQRYSLWAVADGVGGGPQGERASRVAVETVVDYIVHEEWHDPATALSQAFALANRNVYEITGDGAAASTMVAALVSEPERMVTIANVGDSRAYIVVGERVQPITDDHSIVAALVAAGEMTAVEARTAPDRNVLTRSIGSEMEVPIDLFGPRQLALDERLILCTDGVHGMIDDETIGRVAGTHEIPDCAAALVAAAVEAGGRDNATALVGGYAAAAAAGGQSGGARSTRRRRLVLGAVAVIAVILLVTVAVAARSH